MSLLEMLSQQLGSDAVQQISQQIGADPGSTSKAISGALPMLVTALDRNTNDAGGAQALAGALDRDHDGSILDDVVGFLGQGGNASMGAGILGHILGGRQQAGAQDAIGKMSGLNSGQVGQLLTMLAPLVLGALGKQKRQNGLDGGGLSDLLGQERQRAEAVNPGAMGMLGKLLDRDGDGQVGDELAQIGMGMLGKMFGGK